MVRPEFQGHGIAKSAVHMLLALARDQDRWGLVHAFSGGNERPLQRRLPVGRVQIRRKKQKPPSPTACRTNHWVINPATDLAARGFPR